MTSSASTHNLAAMSLTANIEQGLQAIFSTGTTAPSTLVHPITASTSSEQSSVSSASCLTGGDAPATATTTASTTVASTTVASNVSTTATPTTVPSSAPTTVTSVQGLGRFQVTSIVDQPAQQQSTTTSDVDSHERVSLQAIFSPVTSPPSVTGGDAAPTTVASAAATSTAATASVQGRFQVTSTTDQVAQQQLSEVVDSHERVSEEWLAGAVGDAPPPTPLAASSNVGSDPDVYASVSSGLSQPLGCRFCTHCGAAAKDLRDAEVQTDAHPMQDAQVSTTDPPSGGLIVPNGGVDVASKLVNGRR